MTRMGRRRFLESLAAFGVTGTALAHMSKTALADADIDLENEVPVLMGWRRPEDESTAHNNPTAKNNEKPRREPVYVGVPEDQWIRVESARDAAEQVRNSLADIDVSVGVTTTTRGNNSQKAIIINYQTEEYDLRDDFSPEISFDELTDRLPASVSGVAGRGTDRERTVENIPVITKKNHIKFSNVNDIPSQSSNNSISTLNSYEYDCSYRPVPAGCAWRTEKGNPSTIGTPVYDEDHDENRLVTAAHCFESVGGTDCRQNSDSSDSIGSKDSNKSKFDHPPNLFDAAVIDVNNSIDMRWDLASSQCDSYRSPGIVGTMSDSWLNYLEDDYDITKQGAATGITSGQVKHVYDLWFTADLTFDDGDSGCPVYKHRTDSFSTNTYIGGILRGGREDEAQVTKMTRIEDEFNVSVA